MVNAGTLDSSSDITYELNTSKTQTLGEEEEEEYVYEEEEEETFAEQLYFVYPTLKRRWKSILAALVLFSLGAIFFALSVFYFLQGDWVYGSSVLILCMICGLPGG